jgi:hypothetical protein
MATESGIILPVDSSGKATRTETVTTSFVSGSGGVVHMPVSVIGDPTTAANLLVVDSSGRITTKVVDGAGTATSSTTTGAVSSLNVNIAGTSGGQASSSGAVSASTAISTTGTTNTTSVIVCAVASSGNATIVLTGGTYTVLQLGFEGSVDSGTTWFPIDATRTDGSGVDPGLSSIFFSAATRAWNITIPGYTHVRARVNSITVTGNPTISINPGPMPYDASPVIAPIDGQKTTYVGSVSAMSTTIASDVFTLTGSASKIVRLTRVEVYCVAGAATTTTWQLTKRGTADTGGTTSAATVFALSSSFSAVTATCTGYTVAPTINNTVGPVRTWRGSVATTGTGVTWDFGNRPSSCPVLLNTSQQIALNNGTAIGTSGSWNILFEWTEE